MKSVLSLALNFLFCSSVFAVDVTDPLVPAKKTAPSQALPQKTAATTLPEKSVSIDVKDVPARRVLEDLFKDGGVKYNMPTTLPNKIMSFKMNNVPWTTAFNAAIASAGYDYSVDADGTVNVKAAPAKKLK